MKQRINKSFFIGSLILHIFIIVFFVYFNPDTTIHKNFVVYGAHSKKPTHAYFKRLQAPPKQNLATLQASRNIRSKQAIQNKCLLRHLKI